MNLSDKTLILLYREWSEECYCAGFMSPHPGHVRKFRRWLKNMSTRLVEYTDYEEEFLAEYKKQQEAP